MASDRTVNLNLTWEDDMATPVVKWEAVNDGRSKDSSLEYCDFKPNLNSSERSFDWPMDDSSCLITHPNDPKDPFNQPPMIFDNTIQSQLPSAWGAMDDSVWSPLRRGPGDANSSMFLGDSGRDFALDQSCDRPPANWPDLSDSIFTNRFPPAWGEAGPPATPPRSTSPSGKSRIAKTADNHTISYTTQRPKMVSRVPRLKPTHNPQACPAAPTLRRLQPDPTSRIPVLAQCQTPAARQPPGRFPPGMEHLLQEGPMAVERLPPMRVHVKGCKGACGGTPDLGGCVMRKFGRIH